MSDRFFGKREGQYRTEKKTVLAGLFIIFAICNTPTLSAAQESEPSTPVTDRERYDDQITKAESCFMNEQFDCCAEHFKKAYELSPSPVLLSNIAICLDEDQKWLEAIDYYNDFITSVDDVEKRDTARTKLETCRKHLGNLFLTIAPTTARVFIDGAEIEVSKLEEPLLLYPGNHQLTIENDDHEPYEEDFVITAGASVQRDVQLKKFRIPNFVEPQIEPLKITTKFGDNDLKEENRKNWQRITSLLSMGVGGATLVAIFITDQVKFAEARDAVDNAESVLVELEQTDDKESYMASKEYTDAYDDYKDQEHRYQEWVKNPGRIAAYAIGGAFLLGGGVLFLYDLLGKDREKEPVSVEPGFGGVRIGF